MLYLAEDVCFIRHEHIVRGLCDSYTPVEHLQFDVLLDGDELLCRFGCGSAIVRSEEVSTNYDSEPREQAW